MVANNGKAGLIAEHSMMDGMPVINYANYITKMTYSKVRRKSARMAVPSPSTLVAKDIFAFALVGPTIDAAETREAKGECLFSTCYS